MKTQIEKILSPSKKTLALLACCGLLVSFTPDQTSLLINMKTSKVKKTAISWKITEVDLGEIVQNKPITVEFEFSNSGDAPIIISSVQASCGCTSTDYVKTPILPGEKTRIKAVFNAAAKGSFKKQVTVVTSAEELPKTLSFSGTVI